MRLTTGSDIVDQMQELHFEGNVTPHTWYQNITLKTGKPDLIGITLLSDIAYWYRPTYVYNDETGQLMAVKRKFKADLLQRDYDAFVQRFGFSKKQIREAFDRLEDLGVAKRHFRTIYVNNTLMNNVLYIELNVSILKEITYSLPYYPEGQHPITQTVNRLLPEKERGSFPTGEHPPSLEGNTNTKITTKITTKNLEEEKEDKPNPFSFYEQNGFGMLGGHLVEKINYWLDGDFFDEPETMIIEALKISTENNVKTWKYAETILTDWSSKKARSLNDVRALIASHKDKKSRRSKSNYNKPQQRKESLPKWMTDPEQASKENPDNKADIDAAKKNFEEKMKLLQEQKEKKKSMSGG